LFEWDIKLVIQSFSLILSVFWCDCPDTYMSTTLHDCLLEY